MALDYQPMFIMAGGMLLQERKLSINANNLANVSTPSFKKDLALVSVWYSDSGRRINSPSSENPTNNFIYPLVSEVHTDLSQGSLRETGNPLDVAVEGEGFFAVRRDGDILYTRKGVFRLDHEGFLTTEEGYRVLDRANEPIKVVGNNVKILPDGAVYVDDTLAGRIGVWTLQNLQKVGEDFYTGTPAPAENYSLMQGFIEESNVNPIKEMVRLIETSRAHEVYSKLIQGFDSLQGRVNNIIT